MKRHRLDPFSLLFGALFVGVGLSFLVGSNIGEAKGSIWPLLTIVVGLSLASWAVVAVFRDRTRATTQPDPGEQAADDPKVRTSDDIDRA